MKKFDSVFVKCCVIKGNSYKVVDIKDVKINDWFILYDDIKGVGKLMFKASRSAFLYDGDYCVTVKKRSVVFLDNNSKVVKQIIIDCDKRYNSKYIRECREEYQKNLTKRR